MTEPRSAESPLALKTQPVVLIVEDEPSDAALIRIQLGERDRDAFRIVTASTVRAAQDHLAETAEPRPDVILLDLNLPDCTGTETVRRVRAHAPDLPIVVLTGLDDAGAIAAALQAGAQDYLVKGSDGRSLRRSVRYAMLRHQRDEDARLAEAVFNATDTAIAVLDVRGAIRRANPSFETITGFAERTVAGRTLDAVLGERPGVLDLSTVWRAVAERGRWEGEAWATRPTGARYAVWLRLHAVLREDGSVARHLAVFNDITAKKRIEEELAFRATHDHLTRLPNRHLLLDRLERAIEAERRAGGTVGVLYVDLDGFKAVNDTLGHQAGDGVLVGAARRMLDAVRASDTVARLAGDEFTVLVTGSPAVEAATAVAMKMRDALAAPFDLPEGTARVSASVGVALFPRDGADAASLMKAADAAMYRAKKGGKNAVVLNGASGPLPDAASELTETIE